LFYLGLSSNLFKSS